ncbi:hypothetical protein GCM10009785_32200 [Brooklawnia cerclae]
MNYLVAAAVFALLCDQARRTGDVSLPDQTPAWIDYALHALNGVPTPAADHDGLVLPITWLLPQVLLALLVASYPAKGLSGYSVHTLHCVGSRTDWWVAKWLWLVFTVLTFYAVAALVWLVFSLVFDGMTAAPRPDVGAVINGLDMSQVTTAEAYGLLAVPVLLSLAMSTVQMVLALTLRPMLAFLLVVSYLAVSSLSRSKLLVGDFAMVARNGAFDTQGVKTAPMCAILAAVILVTIGVGLWSFNRRDLLPQ